jgi:hypothetical protein
MPNPKTTSTSKAEAKIQARIQTAKLWTTREGDVLEVQKMEEQHIQNAIRWLERRLAIPDIKSRPGKAAWIEGWLTNLKGELERRGITTISQKAITQDNSDGWDELFESRES